MPFETIEICGLHEVHDVADSVDATHVISMLDPGTPIKTPKVVPAHQHLNMGFRDTDDVADPLGPTLDHMHQIRDFAAGVPGDARIIIHCYMGISRSTAVTLGLLAGRHAPDEAARRLLAIRPQATPNRLIVSYWDEMHGLGGALQKAADTFPLPFWASDDWE